MNSFVPYEKLSKRQKKTVDATRRVMWSRSPVTRRPPPPGAYRRAGEKAKARKTIRRQIGE